MKKVIATLTLMLASSLSLAASHAAAAPMKEKTPQQEKMAMCNKDATGKTGDERKAFMKDCLSKKA